MTMIADDGQDADERERAGDVKRIYWRAFRHYALTTNYLLSVVIVSIMVAVAR